MSVKLQYKDVSETPPYKRQRNSAIKTSVNLQYKDVRTSELSELY